MKTKLLFAVFCIALAFLLLYPPLAANARPLSQDETPPQDPGSLQLVEQFGGNVSGIAIQGHYAYVGNGTRLVALDITTPTAPSKIGQSSMVSYTFRSITLEGDYAYVAEELLPPYYSSEPSGKGGLRIFNIADPTDIRTLGYLETAGYGQNIVISGTLAYIAEYLTGLRIVDIADPANPLEVGAFPPEGDMYVGDVLVRGNYAYASREGDGIEVLDVSDPTSPALVGGYDDDAGMLLMVGDYLYTSRAGGITVLDITTPTAPSALTFLNIVYTNTHRMIKQGNYLYISAESRGAETLLIVDISNPAAPQLLGERAMDIGYDPYSIAVHDNIVYLAMEGYGLSMTDVSDAAHPADAGFANIPASVSQIALTEQRLYLETAYKPWHESGQQFAAIHIAERLDPHNLRPLGHVDTTKVEFEFIEEGDYVYFTAYEARDLDTREPVSGSVHIVDVSSPQAPNPVSSYEVVEGAYKIAKNGDYLYVGKCTHIDGRCDIQMQIVDISDPENPQEGGEYPGGEGLESGIYGILVDGSYTYLATDLRLEILNTTDPINPVLTGVYTVPHASVADMAISGNYLYLAQMYNDLRILDISNPAQPVEVGVYSAPFDSEPYGIYGDVAVSGNYAYVTYGEDGFRVLDISDPHNPILLDEYDTPDRATGIAVDGSTVYVADQIYGLLIFEHKPTVPGHFTISGQVRDSKGAPIPGVQINAGAALSATTDVEGNYAFTDVTTGTYTLSPSQDGVVWWEPAQRVITLPVNKFNQDFVGHHIQKTVADGGLTTVKAGNRLTYTVAFAYPQAVTATVLDPIPSYTVYVADSLQAPAGFSYDAQLNAITGTVALANTATVTLTFSVEVTVTGSSTFAPPITNRACLLLPGQAQSSCEWSNVVTSSTAIPLSKLYLPLVMR